VSTSVTYEPGRFERTLHAGGFAVLAELRCPASSSLAAWLDDARDLGDPFDAVQLTDMPMAQVHIDNLAAGAALAQAGFDVIANISCRDRNIIAQQARFLGAAALGIHQLFCIRGDEPHHGDHPDSHGVYETDTAGLLALGKRIRDEGTFASGRAVQEKPHYLLGAAIAPDAPPVEHRLEDAIRKAECGADFLISQPIFDAAAFGRFCRRLREARGEREVRVIAGVAAPPTLAIVEQLNAFPQIHVPASYRTRLAGVPAALQDEEAIRAAVEIIGELHETRACDGVLIYPMDQPAARMRHIAERSGLHATTASAP
jgi:methylenetetrahydrofolate reductase (NADPH)